MLANYSTFTPKYVELPPGQQFYNTLFQVGDRTEILHGTAHAAAGSWEAYPYILNEERSGLPVNASQQ